MGPANIASLRSVHVRKVGAWLVPASIVVDLSIAIVMTSVAAVLAAVGNAEIHRFLAHNWRVVLLGFLGVEFFLRVAAYWREKRTVGQRLLGIDEHELHSGSRPTRPVAVLRRAIAGSPLLLPLAPFAFMETVSGSRVFLED